MAEGTSHAEIKEYIRNTDPYEVESLVAQCWEDQGYRTTVRKGSGDRGIDIEAYRHKPVDQKVLIQVKRYSGSNKLGAQEVRKYATLYQQVPNADSVVIVTSGEITSEARDLANDLNVKLVDGDSFAELAEDLVLPEVKSSEPEQEASGASVLSQSSNPLEKEGFPWFDYDQDEWCVPCPYCGNEIHNHKTAFIEHWASNPSCTGPNLPRPNRLTHIEKEEWAEVREKVKQKQSTEDSKGPEWSDSNLTKTPISSRKYPETQRTPLTQFPWIEKFGQQESLGCPYCDEQLGNTKIEFLEHWRNSEDCPAPSTNKPDLFESVSFADWCDAIIVAGYTESVFERVWKENTWPEEDG
jgi:hypothetical protein